MQKKNEIENKYKNTIKVFKNKEKKYVFEIQNLKKKINQIETEKENLEFNFQNKVQNLSFYNNTIGKKFTFNNNNSINKNLNSSMNIGSSNNMFNLPIIQNNSLNNSFTYNPLSYNNLINKNSNMNLNLNLHNNLNNNNQIPNQIKNNINNQINYNKFIDNPLEENHAKALDDFKKLLAKIDEKLDNI